MWPSLLIDFRGRSKMASSSVALLACWRAVRAGRLRASSAVPWISSILLRVLQKSRRSFLIFKKIRKVGSSAISILAWLCFAFTQLSCTNNFEHFANKTGDDALLDDAKIAINDGNYTKAITKCSEMTSTFLASSEATTICASAMAGQCGFAMLDVVSNLDAYAAAAPPTKLFEWYMTLLTVSVARPASYCEDALELIHNQAAAASRSTDLNILTILLSIFTIAKVTNDTSDTNNDGIDDGDDVCLVGEISNANAQIIRLALWELSKSSAVLATDPDYSAINTLINGSPANGVCDLLAAEAMDVCGAANPLSVAPTHLDGARSLIKEGLVLGLDRCGGLPISGACKCP